MTRDFLLFLSDIAENMLNAERFVGSMSFDEFTSDKKTVYAVVRCFEIIGEAAKKVPEEVRLRRPSIPWSDMARMRDKCIHMYWGIKHRIVWDTAKLELPTLRPQIESFIVELRSTAQSQEPRS